jgi:hypothetical protein
MPEDIINILYKRDHLLKKIIVDANACDDSLRLFRFLIWENPDITTVVLDEVIGSVSNNKTNKTLDKVSARKLS